MIFFRMFQHLLFRSRSFSLVIEKHLRDFFEGLSGLGADVKLFCDQAWEDLDPQKTRELGLWEEQWALPDTGLTEQERRDRLSGAWSALGGQSHRYIQDTLRGAGFDVYVHTWWVPGTEPAIGVHGVPDVRDPTLVLNNYPPVVTPLVTCGAPQATCGNPHVTAGAGITPIGYPLVNIITQSSEGYTTTCGTPQATCGNPQATAGATVGVESLRKQYTVPSDPSVWPFFVYVGGEVYGDAASIPATRTLEFETLCLKICPAHLWIGAIVEYT